MRFRSTGASAAIVVLLAGCGGGAAPSTAAPAAAAPAAPTSTAAVDPLAGIPAHLVDGVLALMAGTPLAGLDPAEAAADVAAGCALAAGGGDAGAFTTGVAALAGRRAGAAGESPDGETAARYGQALEAAVARACPAEHAAATAPPDPVAGPIPGDGVEGALAALAGGLEGTPFEGMLDGAWPPDELAPLLQEVCRIADEGGSNVEVFDTVVGEVAGRFDVGQGDRDLLTVAVVSVAVAYLCPEHTDTVLGP